MAPSRAWWPRRTMARAQGGLASSLSIVVALAACLSATTSEGKGPGWPWRDGAVLGGTCGVSGALRRGLQDLLSLAGLASPFSQGSAAPGSCLPEFADRGAPQAKLRRWAGGLDVCGDAGSQPCPAAPARALLQHTGVAAEGTRAPAQPQPSLSLGLVAERGRVAGQCG